MNERLSAGDKMRVAAVRWRREMHDQWLRGLGVAEVRYYWDKVRLKPDEHLVVRVSDRFWFTGEESPGPDTFDLRTGRVGTVEGGKRKVALLTVPRRLLIAKRRALGLSGLRKVLRNSTLLAAQPINAHASVGGTRVYRAVWVRRAPVRAGERSGSSRAKQPNRFVYVLEQGMIETRGGVVLRTSAPEYREAAELGRTEKLGADAPLVAMNQIVWEQQVVRYDDRDTEARVLAPVVMVSRSSGSPARALMPDGTIVEDREERFAFNAAAARAFHAEHGHLRPSKKDRPHGINLYQWLKNQELQIRQGTIPQSRRDVVESLPVWAERQGLGAIPIT